MALFNIQFKQHAESKINLLEPRLDRGDFCCVFVFIIENE